MRVLTWNLFHGRAQPPAGKALLGEFSTVLRTWDWDVALLQEVPPWWPALLALACGADQRSARTSRNFGLPLRRFIAERWPDVIKSNGGGANAILVRGRVAIVEHRVECLRRFPERRVVHAVRLADGTWIGNLHAQVGSEQRAQDDTATALAAVLEWAQGAPLVLGGDFNTRTPATSKLAYAGGHGVDHVLARRLAATGTTEIPERGALSDHAPVLVTLG